MSARRRADIALTARIHEIHRRSRETYGSPMIHAELSDEHGIRVGRKRVARLMRAAGLCGATLRKFVVTTDSGTRRPEVADLVERRFYAERPNRLWVADATYIPTWSGFLYLAIVLDVFSRKVVGWAMQNTLHTFFCNARARSLEPPALQEPGRSQDGDLRLARGLVQSSSAPFCVGLPLSGQLRTSRARTRGG